MSEWTASCGIVNVQTTSGHRLRITCHKGDELVQVQVDDDRLADGMGDSRVFHRETLLEFLEEAARQIRNQARTAAGKGEG